MIEANKTNVELEYQISIMEENLQTLQDNMNKELSRSYNRGLAMGGALVIYNRDKYGVNN